MKTVNSCIIALLIIAMATVMVAGCPFQRTPLDEIPSHLAAANDALEKLNLLDGRINTFMVDEEIWMIDQYFAEVGDIPEDDERSLHRYAALRTWTGAIRSASSLINNDYDTYRGHINRASQYYDAFNYIGWKKEVTLAEARIDAMADDAVSAARRLDGISQEHLSHKEIQELRRTRTAIMNIHRQCIELKSHHGDTVYYV